MNVLITAASRRVALVRAFRAALHSLQLPGRVVVTDVNPLSPAVYEADRAYRVPLASDPQYLPELLAICEAERVRVVVPTIDDELPAFGAARSRFAAAGVFAACSSEQTAALCNDKYETCRVLRAHGVSAARSYLPGDIPPDVAFPLFIKPRVGRGAIGAHVIRSRRELDFFLGYVPDPIVQDYLDGPEFTIDVLCDPAGTPLSIVPRERLVIRAGVIDRGRTVRSDALYRLAEGACRAIGFVGPINIQCRMRGDTPQIIEINPRFSGGIPLTIAAGANFPEMVLRLALQQPVAPAIGAFADNLWMTSYESSVFLEPEHVRLDSLAERPAEPLGDVA
jgi:carbamoyl-phosphate synthase large subunit